MPTKQLSLWDNEALERGYQLLSKLKLDEAESEFHKALNGGFGEKKSIEEAMAACRFWLPKIKHSLEIDENCNHAKQMNILLDTFIEYSFTRSMKEFKNALLVHFASILNETDRVDLENVETTFDLLLEAMNLKEAESLIIKARSPYPENQKLRYMHAQVQWLNGERTKANRSYVYLLLLSPGKVQRDRIENKTLPPLIDTYGAAMTPAYGWLLNAVPLISLPDEIVVYDEDHKIALECYRLILAANKSLSDNDTKSAVQYRKSLKKLSSGLYEKYFKWVQRQR